MKSNNQAKFLFIIWSIAVIHLSQCAIPSANIQCFQAVLKGKSPSEAKWSNVIEQAFEKDNHQFQCFILCGLSNLGILTTNGAVVSSNNPLQSVISETVNKCAELDYNDPDPCKNAKKATHCLVKDELPLNDSEGVGLAIKTANDQSKGKIIMWSDE